MTDSRDSDKHDPKTAEDWEQVRRSVAMLPPGSWAMKREQALTALSTLISYLKKAA